MASEQEAAWAQMTQQGQGSTSTMPPPGMSMDAPPPAMQMPPMEGKKGKKEKAPKAPKAAKAPKAPRQRTSAGLGDKDWELSLDEGPSRQQMEQEAAAELFSALSISYDLLHHYEPNAASPEDAMRKIESQLGPAPRDMDADLPPRHPIWKGDALVYTQLKRHYGKPHQGSSFARGWFPGGQQ